MAKVKTSIISSHSKEVNFGFGNPISNVTLKFDENGEADVDDEHVSDLVSTHVHLEEISEKKSSKKNNKTEDPEETDADHAEKLESLKAMSFDELKEMAKEAKLPRKEWEKLSEEKLAEYLSKK